MHAGAWTYLALVARRAPRVSRSRVGCTRFTECTQVYFSLVIYIYTLKPFLLLMSIALLLFLIDNLGTCIRKPIILV